MIWLSAYIAIAVFCWILCLVLSREKKPQTEAGLSGREQFKKDVELLKNTDLKPEGNYYSEAAGLIGEVCFPLETKPPAWRTDYTMTKCDLTHGMVFAELSCEQWRKP